MPKSKRIVVLVLVCTTLCVAPYQGTRLICQHRALYPGDLTFIGESAGLWGSHYERVSMWKPPTYTDALPAVTVYLDDKAYALSALTPELMTSLGGTYLKGGLRDSNRNTMRYRFENGKLTWFSFDTPHPSSIHNPKIKPNVRQLRMSLGEGAPFTLPISHWRLVRHCGRPNDITWDLAN